VLDAPAGKIPVVEYMRNETRFRMVERIDPERFHRLAVQAQHAAERRIAVYDHLAKLQVPRAAGRQEENQEENTGPETPADDE
jgi:pyruvate-ferredoxin/flavodoxin oxidoreductase